MLGGLVGLGLLLGATIAGSSEFWAFYTPARLRQIRRRAVDPRARRQDVLRFLHDYSRNVGPARVQDVTAILGDWAYPVLSELVDDDLVRVGRGGILRPGRQLATHGSFVMMHAGGQG